jgi:hypothetical protein
MFVYALFLILACSPLFAVENTTYDNNCSLSPECLLYVESNTTAYDDNKSEEAFYIYDIEDETTLYWFFYQDFLRRMDLVYAYGTDVVIRVGSGVDYSLYKLVSKDDNLTGSSDANLSVREDGNQTAPPKKTTLDGNGDDIAKYVASREGRSALPKQLASRDKRKGERIYLISKWFDKKSFSDNFLDRSNRSYIRLRGGYAYDYRGDDEYIYSITARLMIPRTRERLDLIIGDDTKNSSDLSLEGTEAERDNSIALGVNNVLGALDVIDSRLRVGFSGVTNPYAKASFSYEALLGKWFFLPSQTFRYSAEEEFEEWTNLVFRHKVYKETMFSLLMQRSTTNKAPGMDYFLQPSINITLGKYGELIPYLGLYGRTKEQAPDDDGYRPPKGVYRYAAGLNWSKQASRKYIVYRIQPILSYDDRYDFRPNYYVKALLEFYFGLRD